MSISINRVVTVVIRQLIVIDITPLKQFFVIACCFVIARSLICNCQLLKDISFNTKCLLVWCDEPVITSLVRAILGVNNPHDF